VDGNETASLCLTFHHFPELASALVLLIDLLQIVSVTLLDDPSFFEDVDKVLGLDLGKVVSDDNGSLVCPPALESLKDEDTRSSVQC